MLTRHECSTNLATTIIFILDVHFSHISVLNILYCHKLSHSAFSTLQLKTAVFLFHFSRGCSYACFSPNHSVLQCVQKHVIVDCLLLRHGFYPHCSTTKTYYICLLHVSRYIFTMDNFVDGENHYFTSLLALVIVPYVCSMNWRRGLCILILHSVWN